MGNLRTYHYFLASFCYCISLAFAYILAVVPVFEYAGFVYIFSFPKILFAVILVSLLLYFMPKRLDKPSSFYLNLILFITLVPISLLYCLGGQDGSTFFAIAIGFAVILAICSLLPAFVLPRPTRSSFSSLILLIIVVVACVYIYQIFQAGRLWFNFSLLDVYEYRDQSSQIIDQGIFSYLNVWMAKVLIPLLVAVSVWLRKYKETLLLCLLTVLVFGISQHKSVLFYPYIVIASMIAFRTRKSLVILPCSLASLAILIIVFSGLSGDILLSSLLIRRAFFVPAYLTYKYFEFFSDNQFVFWSSSFLSSFISYPYDVSTANVIGRYLGSVETAANNNFFASGFMHAGYFGLYFYSVMVGLILRVIDSLSANKLPSIFSVAITLVPMFALVTSSDLTTALLTHGLGLSILFLYLFRSSSIAERVFASSPK